MEKKSFLPGRRACCLLMLVSLTPLVTGCSPAPSVVMFGASFPDWLLCSVVGVLVMTFLHVLFHKTNHRRWLEPALLVYPCVTALAAMLTWLLFFPN